MPAQLAWIEFVGYTAGSPPDRPVPGPTPPGIWGPTDPRPTHPIAGPGRPPWWGMAIDPGYGIDAGLRPTHPIVIPPGTPVYPAHPIYLPPSDAHPEHPIVIPPGNPVRPAHPIFLPPYPSQGPGFPTNPIVIPPGNPVYPAHPIVIPPDANAPHPEHPIVLPPDQPLYPMHPIVIVPPLGIWGPTDPRPTHPIAGPERPPWWGMATDPGYGIDAGLGTWGGAGQPFPTPPIYLPPQAPPLDQGKIHLVAYVPKPDGGVERITFTVEVPDRVPPAEATPKPGETPPPTGRVRP